MSIIEKKKKNSFNIINIYVMLKSASLKRIQKQSEQNYKVRLRSASSLFLLKLIKISISTNDSYNFDIVIDEAEFSIIRSIQYSFGFKIRKFNKFQSFFSKYPERNSEEADISIFFYIFSYKINPNMYYIIMLK